MEGRGRSGGGSRSSFSGSRSSFSGSRSSGSYSSGGTRFSPTVNRKINYLKLSSDNNN